MTTQIIMPDTRKYENARSFESIKQYVKRKDTHPIYASRDGKCFALVLGSIDRLHYLICGPNCFLADATTTIGRAIVKKRAFRKEFIRLNEDNIKEFISIDNQIYSAKGINYPKNDSVCKVKIKSIINIGISNEIGLYVESLWRTNDKYFYI